MFAIICDARKARDTGVEILALVDRERCRTMWWTPGNLSAVEVFDSSEDAHRRLRALTRNRARVRPLDEVKRLISQQAEAMQSASQD